MVLKLYFIWLPTTSHTTFLPTHHLTHSTRVTGLCYTKNTQSKLLDQVLGTFCCLCLKCSSFRYHCSGSETTSGLSSNVNLLLRTSLAILHEMSTPGSPIPIPPLSYCIFSVSFMSICYIFTH